MKLDNVFPASPIKYAPDISALHTKCVSNRLVRKTLRPQLAHASHKIICEFRGVMGRTFRHIFYGTLSRAGQVSLVITAPRFNKSLAACRADFRLQWFAVAVVRVFSVLSGVYRLRHQLQIFQTVVRSVVIDVVYHLTIKEWPSQVFTHYKAMLQNIAAFSGVGVVWTPNKDVPIFAASTAVPFGISGTANMMPFYEPSVIPSCAYTPERGAPGKFRPASTFTKYFLAHGVYYSTSTETNRRCK